MENRWRGGITVKEIEARTQRMNDEGFTFSENRPYGAGRGVVDRVLGWDRVRLGRIVESVDFPTNINHLWHQVTLCTRPLEYEDWCRRALAVNPYLEKKFSVEEDTALLRLIGWTFFALDFARREILARVINGHPREATFYEQHGDICRIYWNERTNWSGWIGRTDSDRNLIRESALKKQLLSENEWFRGNFWNISGESYSREMGCLYYKQS